jgi:hypothetical protein
VSRFAETFTPYEGEELTAQLHDLEPGVIHHGRGSTRRLLKVFGIAVTSLEDALEAGQADEARKAAAELRDRMKEIIEPSSGCRTARPSSSRRCSTAGCIQTTEEDLDLFLRREVAGPRRHLEPPPVRSPGLLASSGSLQRAAEA